MQDEATVLEAFDSGRISPADFDHRDHVRVAWCMLGPGGLTFFEAYDRYRRGLIRLTQAAGASDKYSETQTLGWLALIHEAIVRTGEAKDFATFERLAGLDRHSLARRYAEGALSAPVARTGLLLP